jgi:RNA polymerase sigma factor (sigma-70 family)
MALGEATPTSLPPGSRTDAARATSADGAGGRVDPLLASWLRSADEDAAERMLGQLISAHAAPLVRDIIGYKLRSSVVAADRSRQTQDADDVTADVLLQLLKNLRDFKANPDSKVISNFRSYVAVTAYHAWYDYLREKYPRRCSLKNKLRYALTHRAGLALWEDERQDAVCGFAAWQAEGRKRAASNRQLQQLRDDPHAFARSEIAGRDPVRMNPADLLAAIFNFVGQPMELDEVVNVVAALWGVKEQVDARAKGGADDEGEREREFPPDPRASVAEEVERRQFLKLLWAEVVVLPVRQRAALLLNLRDEQGGGVMALLPIVGVATIRQLAATLEMTLEDLARLWPDLPLDDLKIGALLGVTRQQVINLRKSARERLARRMRALAGEK